MPNLPRLTLRSEFVNMDKHFKRPPSAGSPFAAPQFHSYEPRNVI